jgi:hypothetical protein
MAAGAKALERLLVGMHAAMAGGIDGRRTTGKKRNQPCTRTRLTELRV